MDYKKLKNKAKKLRQDTFLAFIKKGEAHLGGSFSIIETILALYEVIMIKNDKFILSKAHASVPLCILLRSYGYKTKITTHLEKMKEMAFFVLLEVWVMGFQLQQVWHYQKRCRKPKVKFS